MPVNRALVSAFVPATCFHVLVCWVSGASLR